MKTRVKLNFFLRKRGTSLASICMKNKFSSQEQLLEYLGCLDVERPSQKELDDLFAVRARKPSVRPSRPVVAKLEAPSTELEESHVKAVEAESSEEVNSSTATPSQTRRRRRRSSSREKRSSSTSEE